MFASCSTWNWKWPCLLYLLYWSRYGGKNLPDKCKSYNFIFFLGSSLLHGKNQYLPLLIWDFPFSIHVFLMWSLLCTDCHQCSGTDQAPFAKTILSKQILLIEWGSRKFLLTEWGRRKFDLVSHWQKATASSLGPILYWPGNLPWRLVEKLESRSPQGKSCKKWLYHRRWCPFYAAILWQVRDQGKFSYLETWHLVGEASKKQPHRDPL